MLTKKQSEIENMLTELGKFEDPNSAQKKRKIHRARSSYIGSEEESEVIPSSKRAFLDKRGHRAHTPQSNRSTSKMNDTLSDGQQIDFENPPKLNMALKLQSLDQSESEGPASLFSDTQQVTESNPSSLVESS